MTHVILHTFCWVRETNFKEPEPIHAIQGTETQIYSAHKK